MIQAKTRMPKRASPSYRALRDKGNVQSRCLCLLYDFPMRATPGMKVEWVDEEAVVMDPRSGKIHYLNPPAALFYALVLDRGYRAAVKEMRRRYEMGKKDRRTLRRLVDDLRVVGLLSDE